MKTSFFATRTIARNFASENGGKVKDFGKDAPTGERWAVLSEVAEVPAAAVVEKPVAHAETTASLAAALNAIDAVPAKKVDVSTRIKFLNPTSNFEKKVIEVAQVAVQEVRKVLSGIIGEQYLTNDKNKRVRVMYRRNMMPIRLAMSIAKNA